MLEIKGRDIYKIRPIAHLQNKKYNVESDHPFYGQTYSVFQYDGIAFTVNDNDEFIKWRNDSKLFSVSFTEGTTKKEIDGVEVEVKTLQLQSATSSAQEIAMANTERVLNRIYRDAEVSEVNDDVMNELLNG